MWPMWPTACPGRGPRCGFVARGRFGFGGGGGATGLLLPTRHHCQLCLHQKLSSAPSAPRKTQHRQKAGAGPPPPPQKLWCAIKAECVCRLVPPCVRTCSLFWGGHPPRVDGGSVKRPRQQPAHPQYANYWAPLTRKRHTMPHSAQSQHANYWAPRRRKRHQQQEHRPQRPTESSDPTQHAKGRTGGRPGPRKGATTRRNVTRGGLSTHRGGGGGGGFTHCGGWGRPLLIPP